MLKKRTILICLFLVSLFSFSIAQQIDANYFNQLIDKKVALKKTNTEKKQFLQMLSLVLSQPDFTHDENRQLFEEIKNHCDQEIKNLNSSKKQNDNWSTKNDNEKTFQRETLNIKNIDIQKVRDTVLKRHNEERENQGLTPYTYQKLFEESATTWSKTLVDEKRESNFHQRTSSDGYYSYSSIMNRFAKLGITFKNVTWGKTAFTESVGYGYYNCQKSDCTNELISAIKTTRDGLILPEKKNNWSHYRAVVMQHFEQMGMGITIDENKKRYYLVFHYGIKPNEW